MFTHTVKVTSRDADAGGVLYFARYLAFAHGALEAYFESEGFPFQRMFLQEEFIPSVVHAESDYRRVLLVGETATVHVTVAEVRRRTFTITYAIHNGDGDLACSVKTVHVVVHKPTVKAIPLPEPVREVLEKGKEKAEEAVEGE